MQLKGMINMISSGLYRAKRKATDEWVVGYYVYCEEKHFIINGKTRNEGWYEIQIDTLGRYCGINDVSGHMIFEGDILEHRFYDCFHNLTFADCYILRFPADRLGFVLQSIHCYLDSKQARKGYKLPREAHEMKIIGNLVDNPDLPSEINKTGRLREGMQV